eukprot:scaffold229567_cov30-Tisochrysis_lutea.AAC.5
MLLAPRRREREEEREKKREREQIFWGSSSSSLLSLSPPQRGCWRGDLARAARRRSHEGEARRPPRERGAARLDDTPLPPHANAHTEIPTHTPPLTESRGGEGTGRGE